MKVRAGSWTRRLTSILCVCGIATSGLLLVRAATGTSGCGLSGSCETVQTSAWATVLGVPLPVWGVAYFALVLAAVLRSGVLWPRWLRGVVGMGGLAGVGLLGLQAFAIGAWCPWCVCVDVTAIALGVLAVAARPLLDARPARARFAHAAAIMAIGVLPTVGVELALRSSAEQPAPPVASGAARIVEFLDIECPFCREQYARLQRIVAELGRDRLEVVVRHLPIPRHEHAREAARVACCGAEQGHGEAVLGALMSADDLRPAACRDVAAAAGADVEALDACLASDRPDTILDADHDAALAAGVRTLPTCFIGEARFEGLQSEADLRAAVSAVL